MVVEQEINEIKKAAPLLGLWVRFLPRLWKSASNDMCCVLFNKFDSFWITLIQGNSEEAIHHQILKHQ
jgi:hypothetical protein